jgi:hypothetical protein
VNAPRPDPETLTAHALGLLASAERAAVDAALAADPALAAEHAEIARHLALYEEFPAPPEPPAFSRVAATAGVTHAAWPPYWARWSAAAAVFLLAGAGAAMLLPSREPERREPLAVLVGDHVPGREGAGVAAGGRVEALVPLELRIAGRVRVVLDGGAGLTVVSADEVRLERGRAYFEVPPGAFRVSTPRGDVAVLGTTFEVDVRTGLAVTVDEGRVRAGKSVVGAGERLADGKVAPAGEIAGAFFRRPVLSVEAPKAVEPGASVHVSLVLENRGPTPLEVPGPETVATGALLSLTGPGGQVETRGLDFAQALSGGFDPLRPIVLGSRERRVVVFRVQVPSSAGSWRLSALYRPQGEAAVASESVSLEVR